MALCLSFSCPSRSPYFVFVSFLSSSLSTFNLFLFFFFFLFYHLSIFIFLLFFIFFLLLLFPFLFFISLPLLLPPLLSYSSNILLVHFPSILSLLFHQLPFISFDFFYNFSLLRIIFLLYPFLLSFHSSKFL